MSQIDASAGHATGSVRIWILAFAIATLTNMVESMYPFAAFILQVVSIISFTFLIIINYPKAMKVIKDNFKKQKP